MEKLNKKRKVFISLALILAVIVILIFSFIGIYSKTIDYSIDEALFIAAKSSNVTKLYYDAENGAQNLNSYVPELYEEVYGISRKEWVKYSEISESLKKSFLSMEDRSFFEHNGVNLKRTFGAFLNYIFHFKGNFGGSTITQQLIKNISGDNERSIKRKVDEIFRAFNIEKTHTKEEIFETYMNVVDLGEGIIGVGEAAEYYFGKSVGELNFIESATLVGMANAPTKYNPYKNPDLCREKRNKVLYSLLECGYIDEEYYDFAKSSALSVINGDNEKKHISSWFAETVIEDVAREFSKKLDVSLSVARKLISSGGYKIYTSISPEIQKTLERYFENTANFPNSVASELEFSMVVSDSKSGNLLAIVGGVGKKNANRILNYAEVNITPGSTLKPIALYAPLLDAKKINWATVFDDVPVEFKKNESGLLYAFPKNTPDVYDGLTSVKDAIKVSKNTVAVRLFNMLGAESIYENLYNNFDFTTLTKKEIKEDGRIFSDLSSSPLALGQLTNGVSLRKLTEAYNVFPNDGSLSRGRSFVAVFDSDGKLVLENKPERTQIFSKECARIMNKLLETVVEEGTAKSLTLSELVDTAGKTGTSGGGKDKLFVGYTPYFTAGIWCGYKGAKRPIKFDGKTHLDIWNEVCREIYKSYPICEEERWFSTQGLQYLSYCKDSGKIISENCGLDARGDREEWGYFTIDNGPNEICDRHVIVKYDKLSGGIANEFCNYEDVIDIALVKIEDRSFPYEIIVTDAEYVARDVDGDYDYPMSYSVPYFYYSLPEGEYAGKSRGKKQFNSPCYIHRE